MTSPEELPERPQDNLGWWQRVFHKQAEDKQRQDAEQQKAQRLADAIRTPFDPVAWETQRRELGVTDGLESGERHGSLRRLS